MDRIDKALQIIRPLLARGGSTSKATTTRAKDCEITPQGPRPQGPPLLLGAFRPRMLQLAARYADQWNTAWLGQPKELAERLATCTLRANRSAATLRRWP